MTESKSVVLPLHYTSTVWSEMKDSNLRSSAPKADGLNQTFLISEYVVEDERIELSISACKADVIPFN